jgi:hypothetical protein
VRGVRLDQETTELTAAAECAFDPAAICVDGIIDPAIVGPALDVLIHRLGVTDRSVVRVGMTIGPRNAGVGSGPAMTGWLEAQATNLRETMTCSGGLGVAFVPSRAIDAAIKLAQGSGIELVRVDLAPVAGARAIGDQVEDLICMGSGRGWQARMRDFEVLEAMENAEVEVDAPLSISSKNAPPRSIRRYGWVEVSAELDQAQRLEIGQLAPAVGAAIGVAYESPANLLLGHEVRCAVVAEAPPAATTNGTAANGTAENGVASVSGNGAAVNGAVVNGTAANGVADANGAAANGAAAHTPVDGDDEDLNPDLSLDQFDKPVGAAQLAEATLQLAKIDPSVKPKADPPHQVSAEADKRLPVERLKRVPPPQTGRTPAVAVPGSGSGAVAAPEPVAARAATQPGPVTPTSQPGSAQSGSAQSGSVQSGSVQAPARSRGARAESSDPWGEAVDDSDPIAMFSPESEVRHIMGKRESRLGPDVLFGLLLVSAIALLLAYLYL